MQTALYLKQQQQQHCIQYIIANNRNQTKYTIEEMVVKIMA